MSIKSAVVGLLLFTGAVAVAYLLQVSLGGDVYSKRDPASENDIHLKSLKSEILKPKNGGKHIHTEKLRGPLSISVAGPDEELKSGDIALTLKLESQEDLSSVRVKWALPEGVRLVSGQLEEDVSVQAHVPKEVIIHLQTLNGKNHQIHVYVSGDQGAARFTEIAQYNTVFEPYLKPESKEDALQKADVDNEESTTVLKVFE